MYQKKITLSTRYFTNRYTITAAYSVGPSRNRTTYTDTDKATSALKSTVYGNKFVWNKTNIRRYKLYSKIPVIVTFGIGVGIDIAVTKGLASSTMSIVWSGFNIVKDVYSAGSTVDVDNILTEPIVGWGFRIKLVPCSGGYTKYFLIYDEKGRLHKSQNCGKVKLNTITVAVK